MAGAPRTLSCDLESPATLICIRPISAAAEIPVRGVSFPYREKRELGQILQLNSQAGPAETVKCASSLQVYQFLSNWDGSWFIYVNLCNDQPPLFSE